MTEISTKKSDETFENFLWTEKYRPKTIQECILSKSLKDTLLSVVNNKKIQNFIFSGSAGVGKTTAARALASELQLDCLFLNASENGNIDTLRTTIRSFASTVSLNGKEKLVILDEADYLNAQSTQPALRGFIEEFSSNCKFILTCNYKNRIIEPLHSRCCVLDFNIPKKEKPELAKQIFDRVENILKLEKVNYNKNALIEIVKNNFPDFRKTVNELQKLSSFNLIDESVVNTTKNDNEFEELFTFMKAKNFTEVRKWVATNTDIEVEHIFRKIYDNLQRKIKKETIPSAVLILAEYQYKMSFSADREICMSACLAELMINVEFE